MLYGSGPYHLAEPYKKFAIDPVKWHSYDPEKCRKLVEKFRNHRPSLDDQFLKPKSSDRKPSENKRMRTPNIEFVCQPEQKQPKRMDETTEPQNI